jgi:hypothetical protein
MTNSKTDSKRPAPAKTATTSTAKSKVAGTVVKTAASKPEVKLPGKTQHAETAKLKHKLIRDSFTIPKSEYSVLEGLKTRATNLKQPAKKSELLRAGVAVLHGMTDKAFLSALAGIPSPKTGSPKGPELTGQVKSAAE